MKKVRIHQANYPDLLSIEINAFIGSRECDTLLEIQYNTVHTGDGSVLYSALIIYLS